MGKKTSQPSKASKKASPKKSEKSKKDSKKSKKSKKEVDPDKPKRPMAAYMLWVNDKGRDSIRKSNPEMSMKEVVKECGSKWQSMAASQKKVYENKAEVLRTEYTKSMEVYSKKSSKKSSKK